MDTKQSTQSYRRYRAYVGVLNTNYIHPKSPWVAAWWSAAFPGMGHLIHGAYLKGFILFGWEFIINLMSNLNLAILYSFIGEFDMAREVLDTKWFLLYAPVYIVSIWDSYRTSVDLNKLYVLAKREKAPIVPFQMGNISVNYLDKRHPWLATWWSIMMPGLGHLYLKRVLLGFFLLIIWIIMVYFSNFLPAIHYTMLGDFTQAKNVVDAQWLMFMPSIYCFAIYRSYILAVEYNRLFETELAEFLQKNYQASTFVMPCKQEMR
ncbi:hypothetical protein [Caldalkalibacillus mannanilyticus]|uniref:hypothetical protein n=1 Tax=Caldalkalibacillus mannanilyticus TaxID=1418 RepID=UPI00046865FE|nr:hypothetical protein [Caldalkalibacillus mannanilyticus]